MPFALPDITEAEVEAVAETVRSGWLTTGPNAEAFEREMAEFLGGGDLQCIAVNSATAGLHLAVEALGLGPGDEVLVPPWTFTSTAEVGRYVGAKPVLVDCDPSTLNMDFDDADAKVTQRTRAVMPVHMAGRPIPHAAIRAFAMRHRLAVVEDAAHAFPARDGGRYVGDSTSEAVVFSFYATKTITTGEGGMIMVRSEALAQRMRTMRLHGINRDVFSRYQSATPSWQYDVIAPGFKYNLPDLAATIGRVQLSRAREMWAARHSIACRYHQAFANLPVTLPVLPADPEEHAWHLFVIRVDEVESGIHRDLFIERLSALGVGASVHFIPLHLHPYWADHCGVGPEALPRATREAERVVSLPIYSSMSEKDVDHVIRSVKTVLRTC